MMNVRVELNLTAVSESAAQEALTWVRDEISLGRIQSHRFTELYRVNFLVGPIDVPKSTIRMVE